MLPTMAFFSAHNQLEGGHLEAIHACLLCERWIAFCNHHTSANTTHRKGRAFDHVAVTADQHTLTINYHIGSAHDTVGELVTAAIDVVELGLCHAIVQVNGK